MQHDQDLPVKYLGQAIVFASRHLAKEAASRHGGRVIEGRRHRGEEASRSPRSRWTTRPWPGRGGHFTESGTLVCELAPVWITED